MLQIKSPWEEKDTLAFSQLWNYSSNQCKVMSCITIKQELFAKLSVCQNFGGKLGLISWKWRRCMNSYLIKAKTCNILYDEMVDLSTQRSLWFSQEGSSVTGKFARVSIFPPLFGTLNWFTSTWTNIIALKNTFLHPRFSVKVQSRPWA